MRHVPGYPLWLGHVDDARDLQSPLRAVEAMGGGHPPNFEPDNCSQSVNNPLHGTPSTGDSYIALRPASAAGPVHGTVDADDSEAMPSFQTGRLASFADCT